MRNIQITKITASQMIYSFKGTDMYIKCHLMTKITVSVDKPDKFVDQTQI